MWILTSNNVLTLKLCYFVFIRDKCKEQVSGYSGARFKKFKTKEEALAFMSVGSFLCIC